MKAIELVNVQEEELQEGARMEDELKEEEEEHPGRTAAAAAAAVRKYG